MRPSKYKTEEERKAARREQFRRANKKRKKANNNNNINNVNNINNDNNKNLELAYSRLKQDYEELVAHNRVNEEYIQELEQKLRELNDPEWY